MLSKNNSEGTDGFKNFTGHDEEPTSDSSVRAQKPAERYHLAENLASPKLTSFDSPPPCVPSKQSHQDGTASTSTPNNHLVAMITPESASGECGCNVDNSTLDGNNTTFIPVLGEHQTPMAPHHGRAKKEKDEHAHDLNAVLDSPVDFIGAADAGKNMSAGPTMVALAIPEEGDLKEESSPPVPDGFSSEGVGVYTALERAVGAHIRIPLEEIFSNAEENREPIYAKLGGLKGVSNSLGVNLENGLSLNSLEARKHVFGENKIPDEEQITFFDILLEAWSDHMIILLTIASIISLILGFTVPPPGEDHVDYAKGWIEGAAILIAVILVTSISSINDYKKELTFRKLSDEDSLHDIRVMREGTECVVDISEIVVGDIVLINPGLIMPCDAIIVKGKSVVIDESSVTGENDSKKKNEDRPFLLTGTVVMTAENTWVLVCAVGANSFGGKLLLEARGTGGVKVTPLQERLNNLADFVGKFGIVASSALFAILSIWEGVRLIKKDPIANPQNFLQHFIVAVSLICVAVPEGLPLAVTISLAYSQRKMQLDNNHVRRLRACETMGNATVICSDKTGTLTQNLMSVVQGILCESSFRVKKPGDILENIDIPNNMIRETLRLVTQGISLNTSSQKHVMSKNKEGTKIIPKWIWDLDKGNKTDNALLDFVDRLLLKKADIETLHSLPHQRIRALYLKDGAYNVFPFTSERKTMSVVVKYNRKGNAHPSEIDGKDADGVDTTDSLEASFIGFPHGGRGIAAGETFIIYTKGGAEKILELCSFYRDLKGKVHDMDANYRHGVTEKIKSFALEANRNIGIAYQGVPELITEEPTGGYIWLGVLGIQDPLRPEVPHAIEQCKLAGVQVKMCTGDNLDTAVAIATRCGIYQHGDISATGVEFRELVLDTFTTPGGQDKFTPILRKLTILARSQPLDKQLLVLSLMMRGEVVAVTGDGTNDAPALRMANVGFVMHSGTDIAIKSASIVLLDDNFKSVQRALVWGRTVNDNIRKFLQLQLVVNVAGVLLTLIGSIYLMAERENNSSPLTSVQLLWVNLIMDTFAALALATEEANDSVLQRGPQSSRSPLINRRMWVFIGAHSAYQLAITFVLMYTGHTWFGIKKNGRRHHTLIFNTFVWCTIFCMFNARKVYDEKNCFEGFRRSYIFLCIIAVTIFFQVIAVQFFKDFMMTTPLNWKEWLVCIILGSVMLLICFAQRFIPIKELVQKEIFDTTFIEAEAKATFTRIEEELETLIERRSKEGTYKSGEALVAAQKKRVRALWHKVSVRHVKEPVVIKAFRRARSERDLKGPQARSMYEVFKENYM